MTYLYNFRNIQVFLVVNTIIALAAFLWDSLPTYSANFQMICVLNAEDDVYTVAQWLQFSNNQLSSSFSKIT